MGPARFHCHSVWTRFFNFRPVGGSSAETPHSHFGALILYYPGGWRAPQQQSLCATSTNWSKLRLHQHREITVSNNWNCGLLIEMIEYVCTCTQLLQSKTMKPVRDNGIKVTFPTSKSAVWVFISSSILIKRLSSSGDPEMLYRGWCLMFKSSRWLVLKVLVID